MDLFVMLVLVYCKKYSFEQLSKFTFFNHAAALISIEIVG